MTTWLDIATYLSRAVLVLLAGLSIWSGAIILERWSVFRRNRQDQNGLENAKRLILNTQSPEFSTWMENPTDLNAGVMRAAVSAAQRAGGPLPERTLVVDRAVKSYLAEQKLRLEKGLTVLATLGANAPFIGLFGTVLGIIRAFGELSHGSEGTSSVMVGISEALVATAVGLFVAIPAVITYNSFSRQIREFIMEGEILKELYVSHLGQAAGE
jgi:biopolymer transport protein ExbB/TolQ